MSRTILLLQTPQGDVDLYPVLDAAGWGVVRVSDPGEIACHSRHGDCLVGVALIHDPREFDAWRLGDTLAGSDLEWIAVTTPAVLRTPGFAVLAGAFFDFHTLPLDEQRLRYAVGHAHGKALLRREAASVADGEPGRFGMVGTSRPMRDLYRTLEKVVRVDAPVLISGESGTGKELAAQAIHRQSARRARPFVPVNCGAIPAQLIQTHLFGHEKGSFTGAHQRVIGSLEAADGGTIFLDEIGDLPLESQATLLRFLQESTIVRIGSTVPIGVDARVVAATHVDLGASVRAGRFREDLFYRLNVLHVVMPPLRARPDDIALLAQHVFDSYLPHKAPAVRGLSREAIEAMRAHSWPGNVRELINRVHRAMIMCDRALISPGDLGLDHRRGDPGAISLARARQRSERDFLIAALDRNTYNMAATARELGVSRVTLYRLAQRLAIQPRELRSGAGNGGERHG